jgi:hypothetical protein
VQWYGDFSVPLPFCLPYICQKYAIARSAASMKESKVETYGKGYVECFPRIDFPALDRYRTILNVSGIIIIAVGVLAGIYMGFFLSQHASSGAVFIMFVLPIIVAVVLAFGFFISSEVIGLMLKIQENSYNAAADAEISSKLLEDILNKLDDISSKPSN